MEPIHGSTVNEIQWRLTNNVALLPSVNNTFLETLASMERSEDVCLTP